MGDQNWSPIYYVVIHPRKLAGQNVRMRKGDFRYDYKKRSNTEYE